MSKATTVKDVPAAKFITALAAHFKNSGKYELPVWHDLVKLSSAKQLCPADADWYYIRLASVARRIYINGGVGVGQLSKHYGGSGKFQTRPSHFVAASRSPIRAAVQALEKTKLIAKKEGSTGRFMTAAGRRELDSFAASLNF